VQDLLLKIKNALFSFRILESHAYLFFAKNFQLVFLKFRKRIGKDMRLKEKKRKERFKGFIASWAIAGERGPFFYPYFSSIFARFFKEKRNRSSFPRYLQIKRAKSSWLRMAVNGGMRILYLKEK